jgi:hypothetical protein
MPNDKVVTKQVEFRRMYTFKASAELDKQQFKDNPGTVATTAPRMSDYRISMNSVDSVELDSAKGGVDRPILVVKVTVTGTEANIAQWLDEIAKRHTVHTEVSSSEQLRKYHSAQKATRDVHNTPKA